MLLDPVAAGIVVMNVKVVPWPWTKDVTIVVLVAAGEVLLNPGDIGVVPAVVLLTTIVDPCPETKVVKVMGVQEADVVEPVHVVEAELLLEAGGGEVLVEAAAGLASVFDKSAWGLAVVAWAVIVLVIDTDTGAALDSGKFTLVLIYVGSLPIVCVRVIGSPIRSVEPSDAGTSADGMTVCVIVAPIVVVR